MRRLLLTCLLALTAGQTFAQSMPAYSDNRSSAGDLVQSLYNAINRHEYLRAYSYFRDGTLGFYSSYAAGFDQTDHVDLRLGKISSDGAAGSIHSAVPVALRAVDIKGKAMVYVGCYLLTAVEPAIQGTPPFQPIIIEAGHLTVTSQTFANAMGTCN